MTFSEIQTYFRTLAVKNKLTAHNPPARRTFFRMDNEEDLAAVPTDAGSPYVKVLNLSGQMKGDLDNPVRSEVLKVRFGSKADDSKALSDEIERAQNEAYELMFQFIGKMIEDIEADHCSAISVLDINAAHWDPVGPVNQFDYCWEVTIPIRNPLSGYNNNDWNL